MFNYSIIKGQALKIKKHFPHLHFLIHVRLIFSHVEFNALYFV